MIQTIVKAFGVVASGDWLGWMFAIAIILGGVLDNKGRDLIGWCVSVFIFAIFNLAVANTYMNKIALVLGHSPVYLSADALIFVGITLFVYCGGLLIGWATVWTTKHHIQVHHVAKRLKEIDGGLK